MAVSTASEVPERDAAGAPHPGPARGAAAAGGLSRLGIAVLLLGFSLAITDFFIVNVALPTIGRDLHAGTAALELVVSGYGLAYAVMLVLGGRLGDALGRRRLFVWGAATVTATSLACALAPSIGVLIAGRVAQGAASAMMVPQVLATFHASLQGHRRARAIGAYGATAGLGTVAGQVLGGLILAADAGGSGWRGIFLVNLPVGVAAIVLARRHLPETRSEHPSPIDVPGTVVLAALLLCLLVPLTEGRALGWPWWSWLLLALVPPGAVLFARLEAALERRGRMPLVPLGVVRVRSVTRGLAVGIPFFASFGGFIFVYAIVSQDAVGLSPLQAGLALTPFALCFLIASLLTARLLRRHGNRVISAGAAVQGAAIAGLALLLVAQHPHLQWLPFELLFAVMGLGQGLVIPPLFRVILLEVPANLAGAGTGVLTTAQQSSLAIGVAVIGALYTGLAPSLGYADAAAVTLGVGAVVAVGVVAGARLLPELR